MRRRKLRKITGPFYDERGEYFKVPLTQGKYAKISREDVERVGRYNWCASLESRGTKYYAIRWVKGGERQVKVRLHHFVLGIEPGSLPPGIVIDHVGEDSLDCRRGLDKEGRPFLERVTQDINMLRSPGWKKRPNADPYL